MDELQTILLRHFKAYPQMQIEDVFKLIYQNEFGCGHMVSSPERSLDMLVAEAAGIAQQRAGVAAEPIGNGLCRLHLSALKDGLTAETLNRFFLLTASRPRGSAEGFERKAAELARLCREGALPFDAAEVSRAAAKYRAAGYPATHHSGQYRESYAPAYRVVEKEFCDFLPLFCRIDELMRRKDRVVCAIDGGCASGKTTLAALLKTVYGCAVFQMDDFFLQPFQRTDARLAEAGGNVDYERFGEQVLKPLLAGVPFSYRVYDCSVRRLTNEVSVQPAALSIVEGVYSLHPSLSAAYDLKVLLTIDEARQHRRLIARNSALYDRFVREWLPMEKRYFDAFGIPSICDLIFTV